MDDRRRYEQDIACPYCGRVNELHDTPDGSSPEPGDVSVCWDCHQIAVFDAGPQLRRPTDEEAAQLLNDPILQATLRAVRRHATPAAALQQLAEPSTEAGTS